MSLLCCLHCCCLVDATAPSLPSARRSFAATNKGRPPETSVRKGHCDHSLWVSQHFQQQERAASAARFYGVGETHHSTFTSIMTTLFEQAVAHRRGLLSCFTKLRSNGQMHLFEVKNELARSSNALEWRLDLGSEKQNLLPFPVVLAASPSAVIRRKWLSSGIKFLITLHASFETTTPQCDVSMVILAWVVAD